MAARRKLMNSRSDLEGASSKAHACRMERLLCNALASGRTTMRQVGIRHRFGAVRWYRACAEPVLDGARREPALSLEMGRGRRARVGQSHEAADRAQRGQADQDRRGDRARPCAWARDAVLRHAAFRSACEADIHERVLQPARQQRGDRDLGDRPGRHPVRWLRAPDPREQLVQLLQGLGDTPSAAASPSSASTMSAR